MNKRELSKIPEVEAKDEWISLAKRIKNADHFLYAEINTIEDEKILLLYFYPQSGLREEKKRAAFRTFLNKDDYITQDLRVANVKWLTASINNLMESWNWKKYLVCVDDETVKSIEKFLDNELSAFEGLKNFQEEIMQKRLEKKHQVIIDKIDSMMKLVPELPEDFDNFIRDEALYYSRYIFYQYKNGKKKMEGFCTHCLTNVVVEEPRHNQEGICPHCSSIIKYKATGKAGNLFDNKQAAIMQNVEGGFVVRYFSIYREYKDHYKKPKTNISEVIRDFYIDNKIKSYEYDDFKLTNKKRWCESKGKYNLGDASLYSDNLDEVLNDTEWEFSAIKEFATYKHGTTLNVYRYLKYYKQYPFIEYLVKLRLYKITHEITDTCYVDSGRLNLEGNNLRQILKIDKSSLSLLQKLDASLDELRLIQVMEEQKLNLSAETIKYISGNLGCATSLIEMSKYTTINKALNYIKFQSEELKETPKQAPCHHGWYSYTPKSNIETTYQDWMDYIRFCKELDYDLNNEFVLYPKNLKEAHDREAHLVQAKKEKDAAEKLRKQRKKIATMSADLMKRYGMEYKGLLIIPPKDADDLKNEGNSLHHCVGTYISRIADGNSIVLFVRKMDKQEEPYCTLEIINGSVNQCRGKFNADMKDKLKGLLNKFQREKLDKTIKRKEAV